MASTGNALEKKREFTGSSRSTEILLLGISGRSVVKHEFNGSITNQTNTVQETTKKGIGVGGANSVETAKRKFSARHSRAQKRGHLARFGHEGVSWTPVGELVPIRLDIPIFSFVNDNFAIVGFTALRDGKEKEAKERKELKFLRFF